MRIAIAQLNFTVGDLEGNSSKMLETVNFLNDKNVDAIIFPENALSGSNLKDLKYDVDFVKQYAEEFQKFVSAIQDIPVIFTHSLSGTPVLVQNSSYKILDGMFEIKNVKFQMKSDTKKYENVDYVINLQSKNFQMDTFYEQTEDLDEIFVSQIGVADELIYQGGSYIKRNGKKVLQMPYFKENFAIYDLNSFPQEVADEKPCIEQAVFDALVFGLKDYCEKVNIHRVVIGLSGGLDSAITAVIACFALGAHDVLGIMMPSKYSSSGSVSDSIALAENLGMTPIKKSIKPLFDCFVENIQDNYHYDLAEENLQARLRGLILMTYSNRENRLLLSTGNKSEAAMGYCTLYGDTCGGLNLICDLYKTFLYKMANWINKNKIIIPIEIINKAPSAELRPNQKDEDSLPSYEVLDDILYNYLELNKSINEISVKYDKELVERVVKLLNKMDYKRNQFTLSFKLSKKSFVKDRNYPIAKAFP